MNTKFTPLFLSLTLAMATSSYADTNASTANQTANQTPQTTEAKQNTPLNITKSANDKRQYDYAVLDNGLKLLVISDKDAQRAAVAVNVNVGSSSEPDEFPGLAHFLEHMLFLGTDKYPDPDEFMDYITKNGGENNAYTAFENTNYHFSIDPSHLQGGLQRFARFFVAPIMDEKYVIRERESVNSEYQAKIGESFFRDSDVFKTVINPKHPYTRFNVGSNATLPAESVRPALLKFYDKYYSAERMTAVIIGKESPETLMKWGKTAFADVPKRDNAGDIDVTEKVLTDVKTPLLIKSQSLQSDKTLTLNFEIPYQSQDKYVQASIFLTHALGHEGKGGLLDTLRTLGYVHSLEAGELQVLGHEMTFSIISKLTDKGYKNTDNVMAIIFTYIDLLRDDKTAEIRYEEIATLAKTRFKFSEKGGAMSEASDLASKLIHYPVKDVLAIDSIYQGYDKAVINRYLSAIKPNTVIAQLTAPDIKSDKKTQYFQVPYSVQPLDVKTITTVDKADQASVQAMHLPKANPFVADDYRLNKAEIANKNETLANGVELYYKNDISFGVPRSSVQLSLQPKAKLSASEQTAMELLSHLLRDQLNEEIYNAEVAGVNVKFSSNNSALAISLEGYQQKMPELLTKILSQLQKLSVDKATFKRVKTTYRQELQNFVRQMPYIQTVAYMNAGLFPDSSIPTQRLAELDKVDEKAVMAVKDKLLSSLAVRMMVYGNDDYGQAKTLAEDVSAQLPKSNLHNKWHETKANVLSKNVATSFKVPHEDNTIAYYIQSDEGYKAQAKMHLLGKLIESQFYNEMRTDKQLGYIVFALPKMIQDRAGFFFLIESNIATADELEKYILDFNADMVKQLNGLDEGSLAQTKKVLIAELMQAPESLPAAAGNYWGDITRTGKTVSSKQQVAKAVENIALKDFITTVQTVLKDGKHLSVKAVPEEAGK